MRGFKKRRKRKTLLRQLKTHMDVCFLQETHANMRLIGELQAETTNSKWFCSNKENSNSSCGVAIGILNPKLVNFTDDE